MTAAPSAFTEPMGTIRSRRHESTLSSNDSREVEGYPARLNSSATRSHFFPGDDGSAFCAVDASTQRSYGTAGPLPRISIARSHMTSRESAKQMRYQFSKTDCEAAQ